MELACSDHSAAVSARFCACYVHQSFRCHYQRPFLFHWACWHSANVLCANTVCNANSTASWCLQNNALHAIFHATVVAKLSYASPAWWGCANAIDRARLEVFLRRSVQTQLRPPQASVPKLTTSCLGTYYIMSCTYLIIFCLHLMTIITTSEVRRFKISSSHSEHQASMIETSFDYFLKTWTIAQPVRIKLIVGFSLKFNIILAELFL